MPVETGTREERMLAEPERARPAGAPSRPERPAGAGHRCEPATSSSAPRGRVSYRLALAALLAAVPLVVFGGTVTTLGAGMAIDGWLVLEPGRGDHFLFFYPLEKWFRDVGTFVEHTHRLLGSLVGLFAIATVASTFATRARPGARLLSIAALLVVSAQGAIGGFRVLENSPGLAFLHGALGQAVFALLAAQVLFLSPRFSAAPQSPCQQARGLQRLSAAAVAAVYGAIFLGAWLRHGHSVGALLLHLCAVFAATALLLALCAKLRSVAAAGAPGEGVGARSLLLGVRARLLALLALQLLLGILSFWIVFVAVGPNVREVHQSIFPTLHVLLGALLLAQTVAAAIWSRRVVGAVEPSGRDIARPSLGGVA